MPPQMFVCGDCRYAFKPKDLFEEILGYRKMRTAGGTNHVRAIEPTGRWICGGCLGEQEISAKAQAKTEAML